MSPEEQEALRACTRTFARWVREEILDALEEAGLPAPPELLALVGELSEPGPPLLKRAVIFSRPVHVGELEARAEKTHSPALLAELDARRRALDALTQEPWFLQTRPCPLPRLTAYLTPEAAEASRAGRAPPFLPHRYDATFHILTAAELFGPDLAYFREQCRERDIPLSLASMDIDDLRVQNAMYGEAAVSRKLLPRFLSALEAHIFGRGHVYGFGRDDYAILLPNVDEEAATLLLGQFQAKIQALDYEDIEAHPTVSIGFFTVREDCWLTAREILARVSLAKQHAKGPGARNCVVTFQGGAKAEHLAVVWPERAGVPP